jgi:gamma-glutamyltranspeptidase/glutathione hydrolase
MVSAAFPEAARIGADILEAGGNAADAACATALALAVCEPAACGVGGQTMALVHMAGRTITLDGSGPIPARYPTEVLRTVAPTGYRSTTVPTTLAVLGHLHRGWGRMPWRALVEPVVALAREGYRITGLQRALQIREMELFLGVEGQSGVRYLLKAPGVAHEVGHLFRQPDLAALLDGVAEEGPEHFYLGPPAVAIDADMRAHGGFLGADDLAAIPWPVERGVVEGTYRGARVVTTPPPMGGRYLLHVLRVLGERSPAFVASEGWIRSHFLAELLRATLVERSVSVHPDGYDPAADPLVAGGDAPAADGGGSSGETTHLSVMDSVGNAVGITQSVNMVFGSKAAADGLGFLYNNYMLDMNTSDPDHPHYLRPGARPGSYVCPTLVFRNGEPWLLTGSPGSDRIISTVAQFLVNVLDAGMELDAAVARARLHCTGDGVVSLEAERFPAEVVEGFEAAGYKVIRWEPWAFMLGAIHAVLREPGGGLFQGMAEVRRDGDSAGPEPVS